MSVFFWYQKFLKRISFHLISFLSVSFDFLFHRRLFSSHFRLRYQFRTIFMNLRSTYYSQYDLITTASSSKKRGGAYHDVRFHGQFKRDFRTKKGGGLISGGGLTNKDLE